MNGLATFGGALAVWCAAFAVCTGVHGEWTWTWRFAGIAVLVGLVLWWDIARAKR